MSRFEAMYVATVWELVSKEKRKADGSEVLNDRQNDVGASGRLAESQCVTLP